MQPSSQITIRPFDPGEFNAADNADTETETSSPGQPIEAPTTKPPPLTLRTVDEILATEERPDDLILANGYLERGERLAICGMGGVGKSRLLTQLAFCHRAGVPFMGIETRAHHLRWLFLQTENGNRRLKMDLSAMLAGFTSEQQSRIKSGIIFHTLEDDTDGFLTLTNRENYRRAADAVASSGADIVVWDPLRDMASDDLNKDAAMAETCGLIGRATREGNAKRTAILAHHAGEGKAGIVKATGWDRGAFGRNSKVLKTWARSQINVAPASPENNMRIILASGKCNNFEEMRPVAAELNPATMLYERIEGFDFEAWKASLEGGEREKPGVDKLLAILRENGGGMEKNQAIEKLKAAGVGGNAAWELVKRAEAAGLIESTPHPRRGKKPSIFLTLAGGGNNPSS